MFTVGAFIITTEMLRLDILREADIEQYEPRTTYVERKSRIADWHKVTVNYTYMLTV